MKTTKEVLEAARDLIVDPKRWTTEYFAKDASEKFVGSQSPQAVCWCAAGAINRVSGVDGRLAERALTAFRQVVGFNIAKFNDSSRHEDVIAAFDIAICLVS